MVYELFAEFCSNSTIHGIRYITQRKLHWVERLVKFIVNNYKKYLELMIVIAK